MTLTDIFIPDFGTLGEHVVFLYVSTCAWVGMTFRRYDNLKKNILVILKCLGKE